MSNTRSIAESSGQWAISTEFSGRESSERVPTVGDAGKLPGLGSVTTHEVTGGVWGVSVIAMSPSNPFRDKANSMAFID
jgi:hypothetical protein